MTVDRNTKPETLYDVMHRSHPGYQKVNHGLNTSCHWLHLLRDPFGEIHNYCQTRFIKIVEFGCGNGILCDYLSKNFVVTGVDIFDNEIMYDRSKYEFVKMNLQNTPYDFIDKQFDYAISFDFIEHLPPECVKSFLQEMGRVSNGIIIKTACNDEQLLHLTVKTPGWWLDKLIESCPGFTWQLLRTFKKLTPDGKTAYSPLFYGKRAPDLIYKDGRDKLNED